MASKIGPTQSNTPFKKRVLRPWKPALSEDSTHQAEIHTEFLQQHLETSLDIKTKQQEELQEQLSLMQDKSVTVGGFFQPSNVLLLKAKDSFQKTTSLLSELKEKEQEITEIAQQLKLTQAQEEVRRVNAQIQAEETARQLAEEKALSALHQAQQATESAQQAEERAYQVTQAKNKLEQTVFRLEEALRLNNEKQSVELQEALQNLQDEQQVNAVKLQEVLQNLQAEQQANAIEIEFRNHVQAELQLERLNNEKQSVELQEALQNLQAEQQAHAIKTDCRNHVQAELRLEKKQSSHLEYKIMILHEKMEQTLLSQRQIAQEKDQLEKDLLSQQEHLNKLSQVIKIERDLRKLFEVKTRETESKIVNLERASKAVLQVLETA